MFLSMRFPLIHTSVILFNAVFQQLFQCCDHTTAYSINVDFYFPWAKPKYQLHIHPPCHSFYCTSFSKASLHLLVLRACQCPNLQDYLLQYFWGTIPLIQTECTQNFILITRTVILGIQIHQFISSRLEWKVRRDVKVCKSWKICCVHLGPPMQEINHNT